MFGRRVPSERFVVPFPASPGGRPISPQPELAKYFAAPRGLRLVLAAFPNPLRSPPQEFRQATHSVLMRTCHSIGRFPHRRGKLTCRETPDDKVCGTSLQCRSGQRPISQWISSADDSGHPNTRLVVYGWFRFSASDWAAILGRWLETRKLPWRGFRIPVTAELHTTDYVNGRGRIPRRIPERHIHLGADHWKDFGREVAITCLQALRYSQGLTVGAVYRQDPAHALSTTRREAYSALVERFEERITSARAPRDIDPQSLNSETPWIHMCGGLRLPRVPGSSRCPTRSGQTNHANWTMLHSELAPGRVTSGVIRIPRAQRGSTVRHVLRFQWHREPQAASRAPGSSGTDWPGTIR